MTFFYIETYLRLKLNIIFANYKSGKMFQLIWKWKCKIISCIIGLLIKLILKADIFPHKKWFCTCSYTSSSAKLYYIHIHMNVCVCIFIGIHERFFFKVQFIIASKLKKITIIFLFILSILKKSFEIFSKSKHLNKPRFLATFFLLQFLINPYFSMIEILNILNNYYNLHKTWF